MYSIKNRIKATFASPSRWGVLGIALIYGLGNLLLPRVIEKEEIAFFFVGALVFEIAVLAAASGLSVQSLHESVTLSCMIIVLICVTYILGLQSSGMPIEAAIFVMGIAFVGYFCALFLFGQVSLRGRVILEHVNETSVSFKRRKPISIQFLMLLTTVVALSVWLTKLCFPKRSEGWPSELGLLVVGGAVLVIESTLLHLACVWIALSERFHWMLLVVLLLSIAILPIAYATGIETVSRYRVWKEINIHYVYLIGLATFSTVTLLLLRAMGYRLRRYYEKNGEECPLDMATS